MKPQLLAVQTARIKICERNVTEMTRAEARFINSCVWTTQKKALLTPVQQARLLSIAGRFDNTLQ